MGLSFAELSTLNHEPSTVFRTFEAVRSIAWLGLWLTFYFFFSAFIHLDPITIRVP